MKLFNVPIKLLFIQPEVLSAWTQHLPLNVTFESFIWKFLSLPLIVWWYQYLAPAPPSPSATVLFLQFSWGWLHAASSQPYSPRIWLNTALQCKVSQPTFSILLYKSISSTINLFSDSSKDIWYLITTLAIIKPILIFG